MGSGKHSPPRRRGREARAREGEASREAAPSEAKAQTGWREARARQGEAPIEDRRKRFGRTDHPGAPRHPSSARRGITKINPVQLEIFKSLFHAIAEEMGATLKRTAFSPNIKERRDYSCAIFDDSGGMSPGSMPLAEEIYQEGLRIPPTKLISKGNINRDVWEIVLANVRTPDERDGDLSAMIGANRTGERRLKEIVAKYGWTEVNRYVAAILDYTERMTRQAISQIHDGIYEAEDFLDDDGITNKPIAIRVKIAIKEDLAVVDFSGSDPQTAGSVNAVYAITASVVFYVFRTLVGFAIPSNAGGMRPLRIIAPEGTIVNARPPAAVCGGNVETSQRIVDVLYKCLAQAMPDRIPAASQGTMNNLAFGATDPRTKQRVAYYETVSGGMGARPTMLGLSGVHTHMTNSLNTPVEALEHTYPVRVLRYSLRHHSGGTGKWRGGDGVVRELRFLTRARLTVLSERRKFAPYGLNGAEAGAPGVNLIDRNDGKTEQLPSKFTRWVEEGDVLSIQTPGGGGWGPA